MSKRELPLRLREVAGRVRPAHRPDPLHPQLPALPRQLDVHRGVGRAPLGSRRGRAVPTGPSVGAAGGEAQPRAEPGSVLRPDPRTQQEAARPARRVRRDGAFGRGRRLGAGARRRRRSGRPRVRARRASGRPSDTASKSTSTRRARSSSSCWARPRSTGTPSGFGEDPRRHPDRFEHFGIALVEAMAAGAAPVVYGAAGPAEIVRDGVDGDHWRARSELIAITTRLMHDPEALRARGEAARRRTDEFSAARFTASSWISSTATACESRRSAIAGCDTPWSEWTHVRCVGRRGGGADRRCAGRAVP